MLIIICIIWEITRNCVPPVSLQRGICECALEDGGWVMVLALLTKEHGQGRVRTLDYFPPVVVGSADSGPMGGQGSMYFPFDLPSRISQLPTKDCPFRQMLCHTTSPLLPTKEPSILPCPSYILCSWTSLKRSLDQIQRWFRAWSRKDAGCT